MPQTPGSGPSPADNNEYPDRVRSWDRLSLVEALKVSQFTACKMQTEPAALVGRLTWCVRAARTDLRPPTQPQQNSLLSHPSAYTTTWSENIARRKADQQHGFIAKVEGRGPESRELRPPDHP